MAVWKLLSSRQQLHATKTAPKISASYALELIFSRYKHMNTSWRRIAAQRLRAMRQQLAVVATMIFALPCVVVEWVSGLRLASCLWAESYALQRC